MLHNKENNLITSPNYQYPSITEKQFTVESTNTKNTIMKSSTSFHVAIYPGLVAAEFYRWSKYLKQDRLKADAII